MFFPVQYPAMPTLIFHGDVSDIRYSIVYLIAFNNYILGFQLLFTDDHLQKLA